MEPSTRRRQALATITLASLLALAPSARATPLFVSGFPDIGSATFALTYDYQMNASAFDGVESSVDSDLLAPLDWRAVLGVEDDISARATPPFRQEASAGVSTRARFGSLSGSVFAEAAFPASRVDVVSHAYFIDIMQIHVDGSLTFEWDVTGTTTRESLGFDSSFARGFATAEVWIWDFGAYPTRPTLLDVGLYARRIFTPENGLVSTVIEDDDFSAVAGRKFWVVGRLELIAVANPGFLADLNPPHRVRGEADFSHTANLFIDPAPGSNGSWTMASGVDLRTPARAVTAPEAGLIAIGLALVVAARRSRRGRLAVLSGRMR